MRFRIRSEEEVDRDLVWYCASCGELRRVTAPRAAGDCERCPNCVGGFLLVMTVAEATRAARALARAAMEGSR